MKNKKYEKSTQFNFRGVKKIECWTKMLQAEKEFMWLSAGWFISQFSTQQPYI